MGNPVLKEQSHRRLDRMLLSSGAIFTVKNPCENSGTPEPATSPVIPHFPHPPNFRGHNSEKCGTGPELFNDFRREQMRSNIAMLRRPKAGWDVVWDAAGTGRGIFQHPPREASGIKRNSIEQFFLKTDPAGIEPASLGSKPKRMSSTPWILLISYISKDIKYFLPII